MSQNSRDSLVGTEKRQPSRRGFLASAGLQFSSLSAASYLWSNAACGQVSELASQGALLRSSGKPRAKSVILIFNCGAPSHTDLWDMKPDAPAGIRGEFSPISTNVPGIQISELLPQLAQRMDKLSIVRTVHHSHGGHNSGMHWSIVGKPYRVDSTLINPARTDLPSFGTLVGWLAQQDGYSGRVPPYVITPFPHCDSFQYVTPGQFGGCLGSEYDPFVLSTDPNAKDFQVPGLKLAESMTVGRLTERERLLSFLESKGTQIASERVSEIDAQRDRAIELVSSTAASKAFDLSQEPDSVRERYGRHSWGQSHLLARRLVESGVRFVTTVNGPSIIWDTHDNNFNKLKTKLVPPMEHAYVALLDDLSERGLLDETLVIWMGDFGRTPVINKDAGRDHWPQCYSVVMAGGGIRGGQVVGESDATGAYPKVRPVTPADIHATVFAALGYDCQRLSYHTTDGRPIPLSDGTPLQELI